MSRIGKQPIKVPEKVKAEKNGKVIRLEGPVGKLEHKCVKGFGYIIEESEITVAPKVKLEKNKKYKSLYGMERALINSKVEGVASGFSKVLVLKGVGYRAQAQGNKLNFTLGFSHPIPFELPVGVTAKVDSQTKITLSGADKQAVGEAAAKIKALRPPEPYKGKGIMYENERIRRKAGKSAAGKGAK